MANPIVLPSDVILAITTIKATSIDPNDFNNAVQELFNRGYGIQGKWIQDHKELYMQALQDGYIAEGAEVPKSEQKKTEVPLAPPANDPEDGAVNQVPPPPIETDEGFPDASTVDPAPNDEFEPGEPADKPHKHK